MPATLTSLTFRVLDVGGHGADDYESDEGAALRLDALRDGTPVGYVTFNRRDDHLRIRWVETTATRQGVATGLLDELDRRYPAVPWTTGGFTSEGEQFAQAYGTLRDRWMTDERDPLLDDEDG